MTKDQLLGIYRTALNHIQLTYASLVLWSAPATPNFFEALYREMALVPEPFPGVVRFVRDEEALRIACEELYDSAHVAALNDLLALTRTYCHDTGQMQLLKAQGWFSFWKVLRNCFAHDRRFNFNADERASLPLSWAGVTIDLSMNGQYLTHATMSRAKMRELVETAYAFIETNLS